MDNKELQARRLRALGLSNEVNKPLPTALNSPALVARHLLALQGQDFPAVCWALGMRAHATQKDVFATYTSGEIIRSWPMRGTLHAVANENISWMLSLTMPSLTGTSMQHRREHLGLTDNIVNAVRTEVMRLLDDGVALTRDELMDSVEANGIKLQSNWRYHLVWYLAQIGLIVFGPMNDEGEQRLVRSDFWLKERNQLVGAEALTMLVKRFVTSHGPCTEKDIARWCALPLRDIRQGLQCTGDALTQITDAEGVYWMDSTIVNTPIPAIPSLLLLPAFDEYLLGYGDRNFTLPPVHVDKICPGNNGIFKPTVVVDGECVGVWRGSSAGELKKLAPNKPIKIQVIPFDKASAKKINSRILQEKANEYTHYFGRDSAQVCIID